MMKSEKWEKIGEKNRKQYFLLKKKLRVLPGFEPESFTLKVQNAIP